jgi:thiol:disulfide interchange protein DsbD
LGSIVNYGYAGSVLLVVPLRFSPDFSLDDHSKSGLEVKLLAQWLVCSDVCIPEEGEFSMRLAATTTHASHGAAFRASLEAQPHALAGRSTVEFEGTSLIVQVEGLSTSMVGQQLDFFPEIPELIDASAPWSQVWDGDVWSARVPLAALRVERPRVVPFVIAAGGRGWRTEAEVATVSPVRVPNVISAAARPQVSNAQTPPPAASRLTLGFALLWAVIGGVILNLMPCVFPVLAIKAFGFASRGIDAKGLRGDGVAYAAGVVLSFVALGGLVVALRAAGDQVGWGFHLQTPIVVAALSMLFTLIGVNLAGVTASVRLLPPSWLAYQAHHQTINAFLSGILAAAVASPCTAPFMGAALGFAVALPAWQALLVFAALGIGMATPYVIACWIPASIRLLPQPGAWMTTLQRFLAFPMFATVVWLLWVLGKQTGLDPVVATLAVLVATVLLAWAAGLSGKARATIGLFAVVAMASTSVVAIREIRESRAVQQTTSPITDWEPWSSVTVDSSLSAGRPVFVDFTAAWCVTCQYNKKTTLSDPGVLASFRAKNVALLRADWTRRDANITAALAGFGRTGVPLYVLYVPGRAPQVLSEILTTRELNAALSGIPP